MASLDFFANDSIELQEFLVERNNSIPSSFTIPSNLVHGEASNQQISPPYLSRSSQTESICSGIGKENARSTPKNILGNMDSRDTGSHEDEFADECKRLVSPRGDASSKRQRASHHHSSKRRRPSQVHNLCEKNEAKLERFFENQRRRNRINEKMRDLQLLIPNSQKTDKASILDEAIKYVKQLQHQVQMNPSHTCRAKEIKCSHQMPQMCINMSWGFMGMGSNMSLSPSPSPSQWSSQFMTLPQGVEGQTILPCATQQNKEYCHMVCPQPTFKKISEPNNECEGGSGSTSQRQSHQVEEFRFEG